MDARTFVFTDAKADDICNMALFLCIVRLSSLVEGKMSMETKSTTAKPWTSVASLSVLCSTNEAVLNFYKVITYNYSVFFPQSLASLSPQES